MLTKPVKGCSALKSWAMRIARRAGMTQRQGGVVAQARGDPHYKDITAARPRPWICRLSGLLRPQRHHDATSAPQRMPKASWPRSRWPARSRPASPAVIAARFAHLPLPWLLGSLFTITALSLAGAPIRLIPWGRPAGTMVVGASTGLQFTAAHLGQAGDAAAVDDRRRLCLDLVGALGGLLYMRLTGVDRDHGVLRHRSGRRGRDHDAGAALRRAARADHGGADHACRARRGVRAVPGDFVRRQRAGRTRLLAMPVAPWLPVLAMLAVSALVGVLLSRTRSPSACLLPPLFIAAALRRHSAGSKAACTISC